MLFNTIAYAKFFGIVFVAAWLLADRRWKPMAPWLGVAAYAAFGRPSVESLFVATGAFAVTAVFCRAREDERLPLATAASVVVLNFAAIAWLTVRSRHVEPFTLVLSSLRLPVSTGVVTSAMRVFVAIALATALLRAKKVRLIFLLASSYVFYAHWDYRFIPLIFGSSTIDWLLGNAIARAQNERQRRLWLAGTVIVNLGVLAVFKYANFGIDTARAALEALGYHPPDVALRIALPIGISFFTFESMSYVIDIYRGDIQPHPSYVEYLAFVAFFPHLVAGPIVRPRDLLPQLASAPRWSPTEGSEALFLIALGLVKKVAIGDYLALNLVDRVFDTPAQYSALEAYAAVLGYAVQIYTDFSGYTDIAIGSALLLGIRFPLNFNAPYKAVNIQDFWRRWHISLSTWLRDYLYISLGGNRKGPARTYVNLMLTMLLGGLWHGANWTFVVWGGLHGAALAVTRASERRRRLSNAARSRRVLGPLLGAFLTFHFVCVAWVFFRAEDFRGAAAMFRQLSTFTAFHPNLHPKVLAVLAIGLLSHWVPDRWYETVRLSFTRMPAPAQGFALFAAAFVLHEMASAEAVPFVYFQF